MSPIPTSAQINSILRVGLGGTGAPVMVIDSPVVPGRGALGRNESGTMSSKMSTMSPRVKRGGVARSRMVRSARTGPEERRTDTLPPAMGVAARGVVRGDSSSVVRETRTTETVGATEGVAAEEMTTTEMVMAIEGVAAEGMRSPETEMGIGGVATEMTTETAEATGGVAAEMRTTEAAIGGVITEEMRTTETEGGTGGVAAKGMMGVTGDVAAARMAMEATEAAAGMARGAIGGVVAAGMAREATGGVVAAEGGERKERTIQEVGVATEDVVSLCVEGAVSLSRILLILSLFGGV